MWEVVSPGGTRTQASASDVSLELQYGTVTNDLDQLRMGDAE